MYRLTGCAAAGLHILSTKPALLAKYGRFNRLTRAGLIAVVVMVSSLVGHSGSSLPLPPRKPDLAALILTGEFSTASYTRAAKTAGADSASFQSSEAGPQMDIYRDIFRLQAAGSLAAADTLVKHLKDRSLMGHVLAQRYLHADYKAGFEELNAWLALYADHPQADRIARLAAARRPQGHGEIIKASYAAPSIEEMNEPGMAARHYEPKLKRAASQNAQATQMINTIRRHIQHYEPSAALALFNQSPASAHLDNTEKDRIRAMIAAGYFYAGKLDDAQRLSAQAMQGSRGHAPMAGWIHGLTLWRQNNYAESIRSFASAAESPYASGWMVAAASYWTARAHAQEGHNRRARKWLEKAAEYPRSFYGLLALAALGDDAKLNWDAPRLSGADERAILSSAAGKRAEKLLAAGEVTLAEAEIRSLYISGDAQRKKALLAYAYDRGLPSLTLKLAHAVGDSYDAALYPSMPWSPNKGFRIDRALIHAIVRQESRFNAAAENKSSGATGLMQLMPNTAYHVAGVDMFRDYGGRSLLKSPEVSLDLGQDYVEELLNSPLVGQDLLSLAIAYNAGPGKLAKWKAERADIDDPLLFIESIPYAETRAYVERVLANYWIYRMRFDQPNESLYALAEGKWARYAAYDKGAVKFAAAD